MGGRISVLGHRGYRKKFPENTLLAFSKAFEFNADGIECDVQKSSDGAYFIFHDLSLQRMTGYKGDIDTENSKKIKALSAGDGQGIPDFESFLDSLPDGKFINIELKEETLTVDDCLAIIGKLNEKKIKSNILISSFNHKLLPPFKNAGFKTGMLFETDTLKYSPVKQVVNIMKLRPWSVNPPVDLFTGRMPVALKLFVFAAGILGIKFVFWTVNSAEQYNAVKNIAFAVITDDVEQMIKIRDCS